MCEFEVIGAGHVHAGRLLAVGERVHLRPDQAERFPAVFRACEAKADKPARARSPRSTRPEASASAEAPFDSTATED